MFSELKVADLKPGDKLIRVVPARWSSNESTFYEVTVAKILPTQLVVISTVNSNALEDRISISAGRVTNRVQGRSHHYDWGRLYLPSDPDLKVFRKANDRAALRSLARQAMVECDRDIDNLGNASKLVERMNRWIQFETAHRAASK